MKRWVAIDTDIGDNPKVARLSEALYGTKTSADLLTIAHITLVFGRMKASVPSGDLSQVPDAMLERWARWRGKAGRFAAAFRQLFTDQGVLHGWDQWNGRLIRQQEAERERWHRRRETWNSGKTPPESPVESPSERARSLGGGSNGTHPPIPTLPTNYPPNTTTPKKLPRKQRAASDEHSRESWLQPAAEAWERRFGVGAFARKFGEAARYLAPLYQGGVAPGEIGARLGNYLDAKRATRDKFLSLKDFAQHHGEYGGALVDHDGVLTPLGELVTRPAAS